MARVKLQIPSIKVFATQIMVSISDINYGNHLGNDSVVSILHEARVRWLTSVSLSELNVGGCGLIMADLAVEYKLEAFYGDQLNIGIYVGDITGVSFELFYTITNQENKLVAQAKTGMLCYNYDLKKVAQIPSALKQHLAVTVG